MVKCNSCGGALVYDIASKKIKCQSCSNIYNVDDFMDDSDAETVDMNIFTCPQCGGEIYTNDQTAQGFCSFCGASTTLTQRLVSWKKPEKIVPFEITRDQAKSIFANEMKSRFFAPKELKDENYIDSYRGIYMPYWIYDTASIGQVNAELTRVSGDDTYYYDMTGSYTYDANGFSHDASTTFADDIGDGVVPYDLTKAEPFHSVYMSGFYGDSANTEADSYVEDVRRKVTHETDERIHSMVRDKGLSFNHSRLRAGMGRMTENETHITGVHNYMLPVWFLSYQNHGRVAYAAINGQTGEIISDTPVDTKKFIGVSALIAVLAFLILNLLVTFTPGRGVLLVGIATFLVVYLNGRAASLIEEKETTDEERLERNKGKARKFKFDPITIVLVVCACLFTMIGGLDALGILINRNDALYYGMMLINGAVDLFAIIKNIGLINKISMRKLPQYEYKGGNTNA